MTIRATIFNERMLKLLVLVLLYLSTTHSYIFYGIFQTRVYNETVGLQYFASINSSNGAVYSQVDTVTFLGDNTIVNGISAYDPFARIYYYSDGVLPILYSVNAGRQQLLPSLFMSDTILAIAVQNYQVYMLTNNTTILVIPFGEINSIYTQFDFSGYPFDFTNMVETAYDGIYYILIKNTQFNGYSLVMLPLTSKATPTVVNIKCSSPGLQYMVYDEYSKLLRVVAYDGGSSQGMPLWVLYTNGTCSSTVITLNDIVYSYSWIQQFQYLAVAFGQSSQLGLFDVIGGDWVSKVTLGDGTYYPLSLQFYED